MSKKYPTDPRCKNCYYVDKADRQTEALYASKKANESYRAKLNVLKEQIKQLKAENKRLSADLAEAYDAVSLLSKIGDEQ